MLALAVLALSLNNGCEDSPTRTSIPTGSLWSTVSLPDSLATSILSNVAFNGSRGIATGIRSDWTSYVLETTGGEWQVVSAADSLLGSYWGIAFKDGYAIAVGATAAVMPVAADEQANWHQIEVSATPGVLNAIARATNGMVHAVGFASPSGLAVRRIGPGSWIDQPTIFPGDPQEKAMVDIAAGPGGVLYACGWDDGGDGTPGKPYQVVMYNDGAGSDWRFLDTPCGGCGNREFKAIAATATGSILLGGTITDFSPGASDEYRAFVTGRNSLGGWVELILPNAGRLDQVNDILVTSSGEIYVACGLTRTYILHVNGVTGWVKEEPIAATGKILALAEGPGGVIVGVGMTGTEPDFLPWMIMRK